MLGLAQAAQANADSSVVAVHYDRFDALAAAARDVAPQSRRTSEWLMELQVGGSAEGAEGAEQQMAAALDKAARFEVGVDHPQLVQCTSWCRATQHELQVCQGCLQGA